MSYGTGQASDVPGMPLRSTNPIFPNRYTLVMPAVQPALSLAEAALALLRRSRSGALATVSVNWPGVPYASWLPFSTDEAGQPLFCISKLAEHTRNLTANAQCSLLAVAEGDHSAPARLTLIGTAQPVTPSDLLAARLLRYQPEAAQFLALGDFAWWRLEVSDVRYIAGFGRMGVVGPDEMAAIPRLSLQDEAALLRDLPITLAAEVSGVDFMGCDVRRDGQLIRYEFSALIQNATALPPLVAATLAAAGL